MADSKRKAPPKKGMGRGLSSLLGEAPAVSIKKPGVPAAGPEDVVVQIAAASSLPIDQLKPGKFQPRQNFDEDALDELAQSIARQGILQPIVVRRVGKSYEIVAGERRWRAAQRAGIHDVPVVLRDLDDRTALEVAILENIQRSDLNPLEEAEGFQRLMDEFAYTQEALATVLGKSRPYVANALRLLKLPTFVREQLSSGTLSAGHARTLATLPEAQADQFAQRVIDEGMSVRELERLVKGQMDPELGPVSAVKPSKPNPDPDPNIRALEQTLESRLGLTVAVAQGKGETGAITFKYKSLDQLDALLARLR